MDLGCPEEESCGGAKRQTVHGGEHEKEKDQFTRVVPQPLKHAGCWRHTP